MSETADADSATVVDFFQAVIGGNPDAAQADAERGSAMSETSTDAPQDDGLAKDTGTATSSEGLLDPDGLAVRDAGLEAPDPLGQRGPLQNLEELTNPIDAAPDAPQLGADPLAPTAFTDAFGKPLDNDRPGPLDDPRLGELGGPRDLVGDALGGSDAVTPAEGTGGFLGDPTLPADPLNPTGMRFVVTPKEYKDPLNTTGQRFVVTPKEDKPYVDPLNTTGQTFVVTPRDDPPAGEAPGTTPPDDESTPSGDERVITVQDVIDGIEREGVRQESVTNPGNIPGEDGGTATPDENMPGEVAAPRDLVGDALGSFDALEPAGAGHGFAGDPTRGWVGSVFPVGGRVDAAAADLVDMVEREAIKQDSVVNPSSVPGEDGHAGAVDGSSIRARHDGMIAPVQDAPSSDEIASLDGFTAARGYLENYGNPGADGFAGEDVEGESGPTIPDDYEPPTD